MANTPSIGPTLPSDTTRSQGWLLQATRILKRIKQAGDPTTNQIAQNDWALWENTTTGVTNLWYNDDGVMKGLIVGITSGTQTATTSGTTVDFTSIPSTTKRITIMLDGVSTNGSSNILIQLGDSGGIETSGYVGSTSGAANAAWGAGIIAAIPAAAADTLSGHINLTLMDSSTNKWCASVVTSRASSTVGFYGAGIKSLSATLDRIRLTSVTPNTFDAGSVNITYE
jgi:hypothetical protein